MYLSSNFKVDVCSCQKERMLNKHQQNIECAWPEDQQVMLNYCVLVKIGKSLKSYNTGFINLRNMGFFYWGK